MTRDQVMKAAEVIRALDEARHLRSTIKRGKHELRLYALTEKETIEDEVAVSDAGLADLLLSSIVSDLEERLTKLKVTL